MFNVFRIHRVQPKDDLSLRDHSKTLCDQQASLPIAANKTRISVLFRALPCANVQTSKKDANPAFMRL